MVLLGLEIFQFNFTLPLLYLYVLRLFCKLDLCVTCVSKCDSNEDCPVVASWNVEEAHWEIDMINHSRWKQGGFRDVFRLMGGFDGMGRPMADEILGEVFVTLLHFTSLPLLHFTLT